MTCHIQWRNSRNIQRQLNAWVYIPTHTHKHTHQALRCLESRDRAVSISLSTYPEDLISQWIHVKWRLSSTSSPTDSLPTLFYRRRRPPERKKDGSFPIAPSSTNISHVIFSQSALHPRLCGWLQLKSFFNSILLIFLFHYLCSKGSWMFSFFSSTYD